MANPILTMNSYREFRLPSGERPRAPRSARLPKFMGMPAGAERRLDELSVSLIGCGGVGRPLALHLARLQISRIWLADAKSYKEESLLTQGILPKEVGKPKARTTARLCKLISPRTQVAYLNHPIQSSGWAELAEADLVVLATDNQAVEVEAGQACFKRRVPILTAAVHGASLTAQTKILGHRNAGDPCIFCVMSEGERRALDRETQFSCEGGGLRVAPGHTASVSSLCSLAADLAMNQILRLVLGLGKKVANQLVEFCGFTNRCVSSPLLRRASCQGDHHVLRHVRTRRAVGDLTPHGAVRLARLGPKWAGISMVVGSFEWVESGSCDCQTRQPVNRFVDREVRIVGRCRRCGKPLQRDSYYSRGSVPIEMLKPFRDASFASLGAGTAASLIVRRNGEGVWISKMEERQ